MSYTSSNLYASRVFAEHPLALWAMDEPNYFISLISENEKSLNDSVWDIYNGVSSASAFTITGYPFNDLDVNKIYLEADSPKSMSASLISEVSYSELDKNKGSICFSTFIYIPETTKLLGYKGDLNMDMTEAHKLIKELTEKKKNARK